MAAANALMSGAAGAANGFATGRGPVRPQTRLSAAERDVLRLLLAGLTNKAVAARLAVSERTVERHRATALRKFGVRTLVEAARLDEAVVNVPASHGPHSRTAGAGPETAEALAPELFETAVRDAAAGFLIVDPAGRILAANRSFCRMLGRGESELLAADVASVTSPDDRERDAARNRAFFAGEFETFRSTKRYVRPDGTVLRVSLIGSLVRGRDGTPRCGVGVVLAE